jgi:plastocyanin
VDRVTSNESMVLRMKRAFFLLAGLACCLLTVACAQNNSAVSGPNTVRLLGGSFAVVSITIHKGETITFVDDSNQGSLHVLVVGKNGQQNSEKGAPDFGGLAGARLDVGDSWTTPPWNTAGQFHVTCTAHPATMTMTVIVV